MMIKWRSELFLFDERYRTFEAFSIAHLMAWIVLLLSFVIFLLSRKRISEKQDLLIRRGLAITMVSMELIFYGWHLSTRGFETSLLPLGVCALAMYMSSIALWFKSERVFRIVFPWAVVGALLSLVIADMEYTFPHFRYIHYFGNHSLFLFGNVYLLVQHEFDFRYRHLLKSAAWLGIYAVIVYPTNYILRANHLFLRALPEEVSFYIDLFGAFWPFVFALTIFGLFHLVLVPAMFAKRLRNNPSRDRIIPGTTSDD